MQLPQLRKQDAPGNDQKLNMHLFLIGCKKCFLNKCFVCAHTFRKQFFRIDVLWQFSSLEDEFKVQTQTMKHLRKFEINFLAGGQARIFGDDLFFCRQFILIISLTQRG